jgi:hypothetical protein
MTSDIFLTTMSLLQDDLEHVSRLLTGHEDDGESLEYVLEYFTNLSLTDRLADLQMRTIAAIDQVRSMYTYM